MIPALLSDIGLTGVMFWVGLLQTAGQVGWGLVNVDASTIDTDADARNRLARRFTPNMFLLQEALGRRISDLALARLANPTTCGPGCSDVPGMMECYSITTFLADASRRGFTGTNFFQRDVNQFVIEQATSGAAQDAKL